MGDSKEVNSQIFANSLYKLLEPVITECDGRMQAVFKSQTILADQINELANGISNQIPIYNVGS